MVLFLAGLVAATPALAQETEETEETEEAAPPAEGGPLARSGRMEFDARLVRGQTAKSGAVYLFQREARHLPPLVPLRRSFRSRIVEPILGDRPLEPVRSDATTRLGE